MSKDWNADDWHLFICQHCDNRATSPHGMNQVALKIVDTMDELRHPAQARGNYEDRHPSDMVLHPLSEIREWDEALQVLGIQDSDQTPADAIRERDAEIERLRACAQASTGPLCPYCFGLGKIEPLGEGKPLCQRCGDPIAHGFYCDPCHEKVLALSSAQSGGEA